MIRVEGDTSVFQRLKDRSEMITSGGSAWVHALVRGQFQGIYTHRLIRSAREGLVRSGPEAIVRDLLAEGAAGELAFRQRRWQLESRPPGAPTIEQIGSEKSRKPSSETPRYLRAIPCDVLSGSILARPAPEAVRSANSRSGTWDFFHHLLDHYRECLHLGGATRSSQAAERYGRLFHLLDARSRWWPDEAGARPIRIGKEVLGGEFLDALSKRPTEPMLLGYPMSVSLLPDDLTIVSPVALLQCNWSLDDVALTLYPSYEAPSLNADWVGKTRRRRNFRATLRRLVDISDTEDEELTLRRRESWSDVTGLASTLTSFLPNDIIGGLDPTHLCRHLDICCGDKIQNVLGLFLVSDNPYTKGCRADLGTINKLDIESLFNTPIPALFGLKPTEEAPTVAATSVISPFEISEDQFLAVKGGLTDRLTVISGPPGTGKSQVVAALMSSAAALGRSALFASHTHKAIDAVYSRMCTLSEERPFLVRAAGNEKDGTVDFTAAVDALIERLTDSDVQHELDIRLNEVRSLNIAAEKIIQYSDKVTACTSKLGRLCAEQSARDPINNKERDSNRSEHTSQPSIIRKLFFWLKGLFGGSKRHITNGDETTVSHYSDYELDRERRLAEVAHKKAVADLKLYADANPDLPETLSNLVFASRNLIPFLQVRLDQADDDERLLLTELMGNLGFATDRKSKLDVWRNNADVVIRHFPIWASTTLSIPSRIPMVPSLFDYVIIDEATTANIAEAIPLIARGKHAIVVGDRMQTGMVSDLQASREAELWNQSELAGEDVGRFSFSQISLFDLANSATSAKRHILRDHFRCAPNIADFISGTFYDGRLFVRTPLGGLRPPRGFRSGMHWTDVVGPIESAGRGSRSAAEARAISTHIAKIVGGE